VILILFDWELWSLQSFDV